MSSARAAGLPALLFAAAMEACRLWAMLPILFLVPGLPPFPFVWAACALAAGALAGKGLSRIRKRRLTVLLVHAGGCLAFGFFFARSHGGLSFWFVSCSLAVFWLRGIYLGAGPLSHSLTVSRYDTGVGVFFCVYFLRMGLKAPDPLALRLVGAYFLFGILALFFSRCLGRDRAFISARSAFSLVLPFAAVFVLAGLALVLLYPFLARTAGELYAFAWDNSGWLRDILVALIRFLFGFGRRGPAGEAAAPPQAGDEDFTAVGEVSPPGLMEKILLWVFTVIVAALVLVFVLWLVFTLSRYLAGRAGADEGKPGFFAALRNFLALLARRLAEALDGLRRLPARIRARRPLAGAGQEAFRRLCAWGRASGLPRKPSETPQEYRERLSGVFPAVKEQAGVLTRGLHAELYGKKNLRGEDLALLRVARRGLASPALLPARLACRLGFRKKEGEPPTARTDGIERKTPAF
ncbi:MAG: DUF4129 domain-containing protein [Spirochaetia bacterium]|jgi:hypothetical protein|nr:DUF4129 domain-containing protein [Spirochaetia bacterium]